MGWGDLWGVLARRLRGCRRLDGDTATLGTRRVQTDGGMSLSRVDNFVRLEWALSCYVCMEPRRNKVTAVCCEIRGLDVGG